MASQLKVCFDQHLQKFTVLTVFCSHGLRLKYHRCYTKTLEDPNQASNCEEKKLSFKILNRLSKIQRRQEDSTLEQEEVMIDSKCGLYFFAHGYGVLGSKRHHGTIEQIVLGGCGSRKCCFACWDGHLILQELAIFLIEWPELPIVLKVWSIFH